jgi:hypothetical protein
MLWRGFHANTRQNLTSPNCISKPFVIYHKCSLLGNKFNTHATKSYAGPVPQMPQPGKETIPTLEQGINPSLLPQLLNIRSDKFQYELLGFPRGHQFQFSLHPR